MHMKHEEIFEKYFNDLRKIEKYEKLLQEKVITSYNCNTKKK